MHFTTGLFEKFSHTLLKNLFFTPLFLGICKVGNHPLSFGTHRFSSTGGQVEIKIGINQSGIILSGNQ
jgi:hypothetical protein